MATIITSCPECKKQIKVPPEIAGKKIRCKGCGHAFVATSTSVYPAAGPGKGGAKPPAKPSAAAPEIYKPADDDTDDDGNPYGVTDQDLAARCPHCANEMESAEAIICLNCGYNTQTRELGKKRRVKATTEMDWFLWLLPGILCVLCFLLFLSGAIFTLISWGAADLSSYDSMTRPLYHGCNLWLVVLCVFVMYVSAKYAVKRLIFNYKPPEVEIKT